VIAALQSTQVPHRVWARPRHAVQCDATVIEHLYDPNSTYHQWMTSADLSSVQDRPVRLDRNVMSCKELMPANSNLSGGLP
jgi:hypothetical protein